MDKTPFDPTRYSRTVGSQYDELYPAPVDATNAAVKFLSSLVRQGPSERFLEFGVGTGRLAIPLAEMGIDVVGIERGAEIREALAAKPGADGITVVAGDFQDARVPESPAFSVVALVFNTIFAPFDRDGQRRVFANAARHLEPGGRFVVEAFVLSEQERSGEWLVKPRQVSANHVEMQFARYDVEENVIHRTLLHITDGKHQLFELRDTYATPGELDLLAEHAGFELERRVEDWTERRYIATSPRHVSVYRWRP